MIRIRKMKMSDLDEVCEIENEAFLMPWSRDYFEKILSFKFADAFVAVDEKETVLGYLIIFDYDDTLELANIAVKQGFRRRGIGATLLKKVLEIAKNRRKSFVTLEVRESNRTARKLYEKFGFKPIRRLKGYYQPNFEDGILYMLEVNRNRENQKT
ncbi:MAG: ribosomal-protein-alanine N-acetyltransferase [Candidatus Hydrothermota bacterium]|nr:MAG: ribosomal-protein-alanine N-acetyltransferase [Candidatus Hydrothermae bacterium]